MGLFVSKREGAAHAEEPCVTVSVDDEEETRLALLSADEEEETLIEVDAEDTAVGPVEAWEAHRRGTSRLHRAFSLFVFDEEGRLLVQQRAEDQTLFPGLWGSTCCSHPRHGGDEAEEARHLGVRRAAERRVREELGAHVPKESMHCALRLLYRATHDDEWEEWALDHILVAHVPTGTPLCLHPEVAAVQWVTRAKFARLTHLTPWCAALRERLDEWWPTLAPLVVVA
jgi:isopentenyl-diphosphate delta-isomerase